MSMNFNRTKRRVSTAVLAAGVAGAALVGGVVTNVVPSYAEPVTVQQTTQNPGFADVVEKVSPAVVSVRVKETIRPASDDGNAESPFDNLPENHPLRRFFEFGNPACPARPTAARLRAPSRARAWRRARASSFRTTAISSPTTTWSRAVATTRSFSTTARS